LTPIAQVPPFLESIAPQSVVAPSMTKSPGGLIGGAPRLMSMESLLVRVTVFTPLLMLVTMRNLSERGLIPIFARLAAAAQDHKIRRI